MKRTQPRKSYKPHETKQVIREIMNGDGLNMARAAKLLPGMEGDRSHPSPSTIWRWATTGLLAPDGTRVYLEAAMIGTVWITTRAALERFFQATTRAASASDLERDLADELATAGL